MPGTIGVGAGEGSRRDARIVVATGWFPRWARGRAVDPPTPRATPSVGSGPRMVDLEQESAPARQASRGLNLSRRRPTLPSGCPDSTMGAGGLNCRVRNGNGCSPTAIVTGKNL